MERCVFSNFSHPELPWSSTFHPEYQYNVHFVISGKLLFIKFYCICCKICKRLESFCSYLLKENIYLRNLNFSEYNFFFVNNFFQRNILIFAVFIRIFELIYLLVFSRESITSANHQEVTEIPGRHIVCIFCFLLSLTTLEILWILICQYVFTSSTTLPLHWVVYFYTA